MIEIYKDYYIIENSGQYYLFKRNKDKTHDEYKSVSNSLEWTIQRCLERVLFDLTEECDSYEVYAERRDTVYKAFEEISEKLNLKKTGEPTNEQ